MSGSDFTIELGELCKSFGAVLANQGVSMKVRPGAIHAVVGENGAGKSTAMKMLYGMLVPDSGEIRVDGRVRAWKSPRDAISAGIGMVHQHFMLADALTALENAMLVSANSGALRPLHRDRARRRLTELAKKFNMELEWDRPVRDLSVGMQQRIEILKLLDRDAKILILDEPTAVLTPVEARELFAQLRELAGQGKTVIVITHKLKEVMEASDAVTVFRAGKVVAERKTRETSVEELSELMIGRNIPALNPQREAARKKGSEEAVLEVSALTVGKALRRISFRVNPGEILGVAGVEGNGQSELLQVLMQPQAWQSETRGLIRIGGQSTTSSEENEVISTREIKNIGVGFIPEDRHREGLLLDESLGENFLLGQQRRREFNRAGFLRRPVIRTEARRAIENADVRPRDLGAKARGLSGGNQQKLIIARELHHRPRLLIAAQPTRGVDIGAIEAIHGEMRKLRDEGAGILLVSSELDELFALSDRIIVLYRGSIAGEFARAPGGAPSAFDETKIGLAMAGGVKAAV